MRTVYFIIIITIIIVLTQKTLLSQAELAGLAGALYSRK